MSQHSAALCAICLLYTSIFRGGFQRGKVGILHLGQQQGRIRRQGDRVFPVSYTHLILSLAPAVPGLMAEGATFIASGIIDSRKDEVIAGLEKAGLSVVEVKEKRGWERCV